MITFLVLLSVSVVPQTLLEFDRILLPVVTRTPVAGANGSIWESVVTIQNGSDDTALFFPVDCPFPALQRMCAETQGSELAPGATKRVHLFVPDGQVSPVFLNVTRTLVDRIFVQLRVHDLSRQGESFGTEIPVVRASEMKTTRGEILDIPTDPRFRLTFRLYGDRVEHESELVVRFVNETTNSSREIRFTVVPLPSEIPRDELLIAPPLYREITDVQSYAELQGTDRVRIEIEPQTSGVRYWAFVSVTNNDTQQFTTLTVH